MSFAGRMSATIVAVGSIAAVVEYGPGIQCKFYHWKKERLEKQSLEFVQEKLKLSDDDLLRQKEFIKKKIKRQESTLIHVTKKCQECSKNKLSKNE